LSLHADYARKLPLELKTHADTINVGLASTGPDCTDGWTTARQAGAQLSAELSAISTSRE